MRARGSQGGPSTRATTRRAGCRARVARPLPRVARSRRAARRRGPEAAATRTGSGDGARTSRRGGCASRSRNASPCSGDAPGHRASDIHRRREKGMEMAIGPVQLIVLGFHEPNFHGEVIAELERLRATDTIKVIDALAVYKDAEGAIEVEHLSTLTKDDAVELGTVVGALVGLGIEGEEGIAAGAETGAELGAEGISIFSEEKAWDVVGDIPNNSAAALILIEHSWAVGLRDAVYRAGGFRIGDEFITPYDLVAVGLLAGEEARELETAEQHAVPSGA